MAGDGPQPEGYLQIGEAAARADVTQRTLRYYEEKGLLRPPTRMEGGFRLYSPDDMERVRRIKELRDLLGFSLADIKEMIEAEDVKEQIRSHWRRDADISEKAAEIRRAREVTLQQIALVDEKMGRMAEMRRQLDARRERYDTWLHANAPAGAAAGDQADGA
ncbi:MAG: MerR family transcriptional regulator [Thermoflexaceae bacterium]|jgi:Predicted transcriptional regulators|nr:MerR family transcriptional regulator [Thermoflexaceae bacterium]